MPHFYDASDSVDRSVDPRAECHALVDAFPDTTLEHLRALLRLLQQFLASGTTLTLFLA